MSKTSLKKHRLFGSGDYQLSRWQYLEAIAPPAVLLFVLLTLTLIGIYVPERGRGSTVIIPASDVEVWNRVYLDDLRTKQREVLEEGSTHRMP